MANVYVFPGKKPEPGRIVLVWLSPDGKAFKGNYRPELSNERLVCIGGTQFDPPFAWSYSDEWVSMRDARQLGPRHPLWPQFLVAYKALFGDDNPTWGRDVVLWKVFQLGHLLPKEKCDES